MSGERLLDLSERWFRLLQRLYPPDFSDNMGNAVVETYRDRARDAVNERFGAGAVVRASLLREEGETDTDDRRGSRRPRR